LLAYALDQATSVCTSWMIFFEADRKTDDGPPVKSISAGEVEKSQFVAL
jgi:hypothetical protein